jgi:hypothetical protein
MEYFPNSLPESVIQAKSVKNFEIGLDEHWKHQECKYDFTANINIRSNSGSDVKSRINDLTFSLLVFIFIFLLCPLVFEVVFSSNISTVRGS